MAGFANTTATSATGTMPPPPASSAAAAAEDVNAPTSAALSVSSSSSSEDVDSSEDESDDSEDESDDPDHLAANFRSTDMRDVCTTVLDALKQRPAAVVDLTRLAVPVLGLLEASLFLEVQKDFSAGRTGTDYAKMAVEWNEIWLPRMAAEGKRVNPKTPKHLSDFGKTLLSSGSVVFGMRDTLGQNLLQELKQLRQKFGLRSTIALPSHHPVPKSATASATGGTDGVPVITWVAAAATSVGGGGVGASAEHSQTATVAPTRSDDDVVQMQPSKRQRTAAQTVPQDRCPYCNQLYADNNCREMTGPDTNVATTYTDEDLANLRLAWPTVFPAIGDERVAASIPFPHVMGEKFCPWTHNILREWPRRKMTVTFVKQLYVKLDRAKLRARKAATEGDVGDDEGADDEGDDDV